MSSQDTMKSAQQEQENADIIEHEITSKRAELESLRRDMDNIERVIVSLERKRDGYRDEAQREFRHADEQRHQEEQEEEHKRQLEQDSLSHKMKDEAKRSLFF